MCPEIIVIRKYNVDPKKKAVGISERRLSKGYGKKDFFVGVQDYSRTRVPFKSVHDAPTPAGWGHFFSFFVERDNLFAVFRATITHMNENFPHYHSVLLLLLLLL